MKIVCAAICKNEEHNILDFLTRLVNVGIREAYIVDTGSTDTSIALLRSFKDVTVTVKEVLIDPFDFSKAKNHTIDMIPADADFVLHLDLDERVLALPAMLESDNAYSGDRKEMLYGTTSQFMTRITPASGWKWEWPVHERLITYPVIYDSNFVIEHHQRPGKNCYESLTEFYFQSDPERLYFHRLTDLIHNNRCRDFIDVFQKYGTWSLSGQQKWLAVKNYQTSLLRLNKPADPLFFDTLYEANSSSSWYYLFLCYDSLGDYVTARKCWSKIITANFKEENEVKFYNSYVKDRAITLFNNKKEVYESGIYGNS